MAEINEQLLRSIILDVLKEMGPQSDAVSFQSSSSAAGSKPAEKGEVEPWLKSIGTAEHHSSPDEVVIAVGPAFAKFQHTTIV